MLSLALPTPIKTGVTWDTGAYDWDEIGRRADTIKLTHEPDPSLYHKRIEEVLTFLKPKVDFKKLQLMITRWSFEKGSDGLRHMSLKDGLKLASDIEIRTTQIAPNASVVLVGKNIFQDDGATGLRWDEGAFAVAYTYPGRGGPRTVWLENSLSVNFRIDVAKRYGLAGIAIEDASLNPDLPAIWDSVRTFAESGGANLVAPNSTLLRPTWQAQAGSHEATTKGSVVWKAPPQPGSYDVSLIVSDGVIRAAQKVVLQVAASPAAPSAPAAGATTAPGAPTPTGTARPAATATPRP